MGWSSPSYQADGFIMLPGTRTPLQLADTRRPVTWEEKPGRGQQVLQVSHRLRCVHVDKYQASPRPAALCRQGG